MWKFNCELVKAVDSVGVISQFKKDTDERSNEAIINGAQVKGAAKYNIEWRVELSEGFPNCRLSRLGVNLVPEKNLVRKHVMNRVEVPPRCVICEMQYESARIEIVETARNALPASRQREGVLASAHEDVENSLVVVGDVAIVFDEHVHHLQVKFLISKLL